MPSCTLGGMHRLPRSLGALAVLATLFGSLTAPAGASTQPVPAPVPVAPAHRHARAVLDRASALLEGATPLARAGGDGARRPDARPDASLALTELFRVRGRLTGADRRHADALLARPTDGPSDPYGDGYLTADSTECGPHVCLHWVTLGADAPPSRAWVDSTLAVLERVWTREVDDLGYRRPLSDAGYSGNGGDGRLDVYLKDVGARGLYGYCAPEHRPPGARRTASGFCVLDDDFSSAQFGAAPEASRAVTAAHEFFHTVQFAYDATDDPWFLESTATWMEERVADAVNDNRQYLPSSQVARPGTPLDLFDSGGVEQYGNWAFWEFLTERAGNGLVRRVWQRAAAYRGAPDDYSTEALAHVLGGRSALAAAYARFSAANLAPRHSYDEGAAWPTAPVRSTTSLGPGRRRVARSVRLDHLTSAAYRLVPDERLGRGWRAGIRVTGPGDAASPAAVVLVRRTRGWRTVVVPVRDGRGTLTLPFDARDVRWVDVALVNASQRFACGTAGRGASSLYSCYGRPRDDQRRFGLAVSLRRP